MSSRSFGDPGFVDPDLVERVVAGLRLRGVALVTDALPAEVVASLAGTVRARPPEEFAEAGVGRSEDHVLDTTIRSDQIIWLDADDVALGWYFAWIEELRRALNRQLFLGLFDYECHFAWYPVGARYRRHVDAFRGRGNRKVSTVLYLNPGWRPGHGGELVVFDGQRDAVQLIVEPRLGTLVVFLSEEIPHEVLAAREPRYSIAGWFRVNPSGRGRVDPPVHAGVDGGISSPRRPG